jgi:hypothetical protein
MVGALMLDHFSRSELACPTTDQVRLAAGFGEALERLRVELDEPVYLTSACRSPQHNAKVRRHPRSRHLTVNDYWGTSGTCAVDAFATDGQYGAKLIRLALDQDRSVGVASNCIHLDQRFRYCGLGNNQRRRQLLPPGRNFCRSATPPPENPPAAVLYYIFRPKGASCSHRQRISVRQRLGPVLFFLERLL